jgi:HEAT repeat protein
MKFQDARQDAPIPLTGLPGGPVLARSPILTYILEGGRLTGVRLQFALSPEDWSRVDEAGAFGLSPEERHPPGQVPDATRSVQLECSLDKALLPSFGGDYSTPDDALEALAQSPSSGGIFAHAAWPALAVMQSKPEDPELSTGFSTIRYGREPSPPAPEPDMSPELSAFLDTLGDHESYKMTYPIHWFSRLNEADQEVALERLRERVTDHDDVKAGITLAEIGDFTFTRSLEALADRLDGEGDRTVLSAAIGRMIPGDPDAVRELADQLDAEGRFTRIAAASSLAEHKTSVARRALIGALSDPAGEVRLAAYQAFLEQLDLTPLTENAEGRTEPKSPLKVLEQRVINDLEAVAGPARGHVVDLGIEIDIGSTPEELDLVYQPPASPVDRMQVARALMKTGQPLPMDRLGAAEGHDRAWIEALLLRRLSREVRDVRVPAACIALEVRGAEAAMRESAEDLPADHPFAEAVASALQG